ncbi:hypothetical protein HPB47_015420 [Ixodes persulcatus]|uniref:Uncharacterized protein n=1 Tax=Ixodes persulcatus TaxID=34615 RepID=A0AC60QW51_IXOPE|nr:hypothetical protein HPB47_015420 [Ixodes persulcatus]
MSLTSSQFTGTSLRAIDVSAHSPEIPLSWLIAADTKGSDHFPVFIDIIDLQRQGVREVSVIHWDRFRDNLGRSTRPLLKAIRDAAKKAPIKATGPTLFRAPNLTLLKLCAERRRVQPPRRIRRLMDSLSRKRRFSLPFASLALCTRKLLTTLAAAVSQSNPRCHADKTPFCMDAPFTEYELRSALRACKRRGAPGPDRRQTRGRFIVLPAVVFTYCVAKLFERLVHARLIWWLEEHHLLSLNMTGFRSRLSAQDSILDIVSALQHAAASRKSTVAAFFDIEAAFDNAETAPVQAQPTSWGVTGSIQDFLEGFLSNRSIQGKLQLDYQPLRLVSKHCFLGITLENRCKWHHQVKAVTASTISSRNAADKPQRLHRTGLIPSLGVPRSAKNERVYEEARSLPLHLQASQRLLLQILRLGETRSGPEVNASLASPPRPLSHLDGNPPDNQPARQEKPPWEAGLQLAEFLPGAAAQEKLAPTYPQPLHIYTDGSVDWVRQSSTAAFHIPDLQKDGSARTTHMVSSTTTELLAITEALVATKSLPPQQMVLFKDSRGGVQRIRKPGPCPTANEVRGVARKLEEHQHFISLKWVPSHVRLRGNEIVGRIASRARDLSPTLRAPPDPRRYQHAIQAFFSTLSLWGSSKRPPCLTQGLKRSDATLLFRLRTGSAYTGRHLHRFGRRDTPVCQRLLSPRTTLI